MAKAKKPVKKVPAKSATKPMKKMKAKPATKSAPKKATKASKPTAKKSAPKKSPAKKSNNVKTAVKKPAANLKASTKKPTTKSASKSSGNKIVSRPVSFVDVKPAKQVKDFDKFMTPLDDRVVVQASEGERITAGGLYIPDTVSDVSGNRKGAVVAVGRGRRDKKGKVHSMDIKKGDRIIFPQYAGNEIEFEKTKLIILRESDVLGILS